MNSTVEQKALELLAQITERRDAEIVDKWRYAQTAEERELCATELRTLGELKREIETEISNERRRTDK